MKSMKLCSAQTHPVNCGRILIGIFEETVVVDDETVDDLVGSSLVLQRHETLTTPGVDKHKI